MRSNLVDLALHLDHETDAAILVSDDGEKKVWLPKSQVEFEPDARGDGVTVTLPQWLAEEKRLV